MSLKIKIQFLSGKVLFIVHVLLIFLLTNLVVSTYAIEKETLVRLVNDNRVLSSALELHLTALDSAMINSTVSLSHEDAWLFFDNIRPSDVIASYKSNILIGESVLNPGVNGRVAIYKHGTVVMPFGYTFKPLKVYTEENFTGDSTQLAIEIYHNDLGDFDNAIKSFKLKRGYMVTLANNADGTGYSRVFIANDSDLDFSVMPAELYRTVSFIRVFKHEWVTKKGWVEWDPSESTLNLTNSTWFYSWNAFKNTTANSEFVPMRSKLTYPGWNEINEKTNVSHMLSYNEPDHPEQHKDDNGEKALTIDQALEQMPDHMKSGLRIGAPATTNFNWVIDFVKRCDELNYRVDYVAVHAYWGNDPSGYLSSLSWVHNATGRPIWITEWNYGANWTNEWWPDNTQSLTPANEEYAYQKIKAIVDFFDKTPWIERYSIYNWVEDRRAIILNGELTKAGKYYASNNSVEAFNRSYEVIPHWNYQEAPELSYRYYSLRNSIRLSWTNSDGELVKKYILQKKVNNGEYKTIYSSDDISKQVYVDPLDSAYRGKITCRVTLLTAYGEHIKSNEVSYYQTAGDNEIQMGNFSVDNLDINTTFFPEKYTSNPLVIMGIQGFNNPVPLTQRVNDVSATSFRFFISPWSYLSNPQVTKSDLLATIALPAGTYDFGGLKAEAKFIDGITHDWITVDFDQEFEKVPVVFATIVSSSNPYPLTVGVRNVTATGFEMCLKSEEAITAALSPETINYFAIESGQGVIVDKRVTVGWNYENIGISSNSIEIPYDTTYTQVAIFAGLLSAEDNFASTLRYSNNGESSFKIIKRRELSEGESAMKADDSGWMVVDLATDQPIVETGVAETSLRNSLVFYPNPAKHTVHFNFNKPTHVEILDLTGHTLIESNVSQSMNIRSLSTGIYILKAEGCLPGKLIIAR